MRLCLIALLLMLSACSREPLYQSQSYVFGTLVDITIYGEKDNRARELAQYIEQDFQKLHKQLHAWETNSELSQLNAAIASGKTINISDDLASILKQAALFSEQSNGLFNPTIGHLIAQWGFQNDKFQAIEIDQKIIKTLVNKHPSMTDITIKPDTNGYTAYSNNAAVKLDLGGYAKGYALDRAATYLHSQGANNALINIGGNIIALGQHGDNHWRVGIQHPRKAGPIATVDLLDGWAIGTSGDYQRYFELNGQRYCHIIDPRTGYPASNTQAVTILVPPSPLAGTLSDVATKPIFIAAENQKADAAKKMHINHYLIINAKGDITVSPDMKTRINWVK